MQTSPLILLMADLGVVLVVAMLLGALAERVHLPAICGQLMAGVVLGPTLLGAAFPRAEHLLFPAHDVLLKTVRTDFLQVGLLLFIFFVGLEIDVGLMRARLRAIVPISGCGLIIPFVVGFAAVAFFPHYWGGPNPQALPWIMAVAVAISALPVIGAIISDLGLMRTHVGQMILSAAVIDDLCGWLGFAAVAAAFSPSPHGARPLWETVVIVLGSFLLAITLARKAGTFAETWVEHHVRRAGFALGVILALALLASAVAEGVGAHAFFGALLVGLALSSGHKEFLKPAEQAVRNFFAPLYFGAVGLSVNFVASFDLGLVALVFGIACLGKLSGVIIGARLGGCSGRDGLAIASGMNARGAIEILLAVLALSEGLIDARIFEAIVVMALATSILAGFLLQAIMGHKRPAVRAKHRGLVLQHLDHEAVSQAVSQGSRPRRA